MKRRLAVAGLIGCVYGLLTYGLLSGRRPDVMAMDFTYPWLAARAVVQGIDPYAYVQAQPTPFTHTLFYPLPAAFVALPVAWIPVRLAGAVFVGLGCGLLAFAVTKRETWRALLFVTAPAYQVAWSVQWTPLLMASALWPVALGLVVTKPNLALPLLAYQTSRRAIAYAVIGGALLLAVSLIVRPVWPWRWYETLHNAPVASQYRIPILTRWGPVLALAALRWRTREGRLVLAMACAPQNFFYYDQFPLFLAARSRKELLAMACVSWLVFLVPFVHPFNAKDAAELSVRFIPLMMLGAYLPALAIVLCRPNA